MMSEHKQTFYVLDFDRTLFDTSAVVQHIEQFLMVEYPDIAETVGRERQRVEMSGGSYDMLASIRQHAPDTTDDLLASFVEHERHESLLLPGADALMAAIEHAGHEWGIMTYGGEQWQRAKLRMAGLEDAAALVIERKGKGERIAGWRDDDGLYRLPRELGSRVVRQIVIVDDKASEFAGLPGDDSTRGYWVRNAASALPSQEGSVPGGVSTVGTLHDVIAQERL